MSVCPKCAGRTGHAEHNKQHDSTWIVCASCNGTGNTMSAIERLIQEAERVHGDDWRHYVRTASAELEGYRKLARSVLARGEEAIEKGTLEHLREGRIVANPGCDHSAPNWYVEQGVIRCEECEVVRWRSRCGNCNAACTKCVKESAQEVKERLGFNTPERDIDHIE